MAASDAAWRSLHPASVLVNLIPTAWRALRSLWPIALALFIGGARRDVALVDVFLVGTFLVLPIFRTVVHWATLRYRVARGHLVIQTGILNRQERTIPPERIQNVELVRNVFHRMSGLVELRVETASGTDIEGMLSALSVDEAQRLMQELAQARGRVSPAERQEAPAALLTNGPADLLRYGLSSARLGLVLVVLGVVYEFLLTDVERMETTWAQLGSVGTFVAFIALVVGAWLFGAATVLVRHWDYRLFHLDDRLVAEEGLLTRRRVELPTSKVQLVMVREPFVRRLMGFGSVHIETAAAREEGGGTQRAEAVVPVVHTERIGDLLEHALPEVPRDLGTLPYTPPHPRALLRAWISGAAVTLTIATLATVLFAPIGLLAWLLVPLDLASSWLDHRHQGWWLGPRHLVSRTGWWVRSTRIVALEKLQSVAVAQGPLARRWGLGSLRMRAAGSGVSVPVQAWEDALDLEVQLVRTAVSLPVERVPDVAPALDDHQDTGSEHHPPHPLLHGEHEQEAGEHDQVPLAPSPAVGDRDQADDPTEQEGGEPAEQRSGGGGVHLPVETDLPDGPDPGLERARVATSHEADPERDVQSGDEDSQA